MATIEQARQQIASQRKSIQETRKKIESVKTKVPVTRAQLQSATRETQLKRKIQEQKLKKKKEEALGKLRMQEQKFEEQVKPIEKKIEKIEKTPQYYIQTTGMKGKPIYGRVVKGSAEEVIGYRYETPYGVLEDYSLRDYKIRREAAVEMVEGHLKYLKKNIPQIKTEVDLSSAKQSNAFSELTFFKPALTQEEIERGFSYSFEPLVSTYEGVKRVSEVYPEFQAVIPKAPVKESSDVMKVLGPLNIGLNVVSPLAKPLTKPLAKQAIKLMRKYPSPQKVLSEKLKEKNVDLTKSNILGISDIANFEKIRQEEKEKQLDLEKALEKFRMAKTYDEQQKALEELRKYGINNYRVRDEIVLTNVPEKRKFTTLSFLGREIAGQISSGTKEIYSKVKAKIPEQTRKDISIVFSRTYEKSSVKPVIGLMRKYPSPQKVFAKEIKKQWSEKPEKERNILFFTDIEKGYRKEVSEGREQGRTRFFLEKLGEGYKEAGMSISETIIKLQEEGKYVSPWIKIKEPSYEYSKKAKIVGGVTGLIGETQAYFLPVVGTTVVLSPFAEAASRRELKRYIIKNPLETAFATLFVGGKIVSGISKLKEPRIYTETLTKKVPEPLGYIGKPSKQITTGKKQITIFEDITGRSVSLKEGQKKIVTSRIREILGLKPIYEGIPYGKVGSKEYKKALKYLISQGYTETQARSLLKLKQPIISKNVFTGKAIIEETEDLTKIKIKGTEKSVKVSDTIKGVKTRLGKGEMKFISAEGVPRGTKKGIDLYEFTEEIKKAYLTKKGAPYSKISQIGKTSEELKLLTGVKEIKEISIQKNILQTERLSIGKETPFKLYKEADIYRRINPFQRELKGAITKVLVEQGEPKLRITLDLEKDVKMFKGGGKKSSEQFLSQMYQPEQGLSSGLIKITTPAKISRIIKPEAAPILKTSGFEIKSAIGSITTKKDLIKEQFTELQMKFEKIKPISVNFGVFEGRIKTDSRLSVELKSGQEQRVFSKERIDIGIKPLERYELKSLLETKQGLSFKLGQELLLETKQIKKIAKVLRISETLKEKKIPTTQKLPKKMPPFEPVQDIKTLAKAIKKREEFEVFGKRFGKYKSLGVFETKQKAKQKAEKFLKTTLGRSAKIFKEGKPLGFEELGFGFEFRPSKRDVKTIVQKAEFSLGTPSEVSEIQLFKRKKKLKKRRWV